MYLFQICLILDAKFAKASLCNFHHLGKSKVSLLVHEVTSQAGFFFEWYTFIKGWYIYCDKYRRKNLNVYPNSYSLEGNFLFRGDSTNKRKKQERRDETNEKSDNHCKWFMD